MEDANFQRLREILRDLPAFRSQNSTLRAGSFTTPPGFEGLTSEDYARALAWGGYSAVPPSMPPSRRFLGLAFGFGRGPISDEESCAICWLRIEPFEATITHVDDPCKVTFHDSCLDWVISDAASRNPPIPQICPMCRQSLRPRDQPLQGELVGGQGARGSKRYRIWAVGHGLLELDELRPLANIPVGRNVLIGKLNLKPVVPQFYRFETQVKGDVARYLQDFRERGNLLADCEWLKVTEYQNVWWFEPLTRKQRLVFGVDTDPTEQERADFGLDVPAMPPAPRPGFATLAIPRSRRVKAGKKRAGEASATPKKGGVTKKRRSSGRER